MCVFKCVNVYVSGDHVGHELSVVIGSKRKSSEEDELKKLGIDDEPINLDGEEEI